MSSYYSLPKGNIQLSNCFKITFSDTPPPNTLSPSLTHYLYEILNNEQINTDFFNRLQKIVYPYNKLINNQYSPECLEFVEIMQTMNLNIYLDNNFKTQQLQLLYFEKQNPSNLDFRSFAAFQKRFESNFSVMKSKVFYCNNTTYNLNTFEKIYMNYAAKNHVIIATQSIQMNTKQILIQICMALCTQCKKGIFIWKIGDCYTNLILEIFYFLSSFYDKIYIIKPSIIDVSKPYRYIVCKGFLYDNSYSIYTYLRLFVKYIDAYHYSKKYICSFLNVHIPHFFLNKLEEVNYIYGQNQLEQIHYLLLLCEKHKNKDDKLQNICSLNEHKCIEWCRKHRILL
jgi:hypothetical protein